VKLSCQSVVLDDPRHRFNKPRLAKRIDNDLVDEGLRVDLEIAAGLLNCTVGLCDNQCANFFFVLIANVLVHEGKQCVPRAAL
jgi:hypothetical protein